MASPVLVDMWRQIASFASLQTPLQQCTALALVLTAITFLHSVVTGRHFLVDRYFWTHSPPLYAFIYLYAEYKLTGELSWRLFAVSALLSVWCIRLTFVFYRKGGFRGHAEDYRWPIIYKRVEAFTPFPKLSVLLFDLVVYATYQILLVTMVACIPLEGLFDFTMNNKQSSTVLLVTDLCFIFALVMSILGAGVADQQQWNFQCLKHTLLHRQRQGDSVKLPRDVERGFLSSGLWRFSRHPNFFFENLFWWCLAEYPVVLFYVSGHRNVLMDWGWWLGAGMYSVLFLASTSLTESISASKYPEYTVYQKRVPGRIIPWFSRVMSSSSHTGQVLTHKEHSQKHESKKVKIKEEHPSTRVKKERLE